MSQTSPRCFATPSPCALACLGAALLGACSAPALQLAPRLMQVDLEGEVGIASGSVSGTNDLERAGVEKDDSVFGARVDIDLGAPHLSVSTQASTHDGRGTLEFDLTQNGVTISAGADVDTAIDMALHQLALTWDLIPTDMVEIGIGVGVAAIDLDASFTEVGTANSIETDEIAALPVLAARAGVDLGRIDISLLATGLRYDIDGDEAQLLDFDLLGRLQLFGGDKRLAGFLLAGYRDASAEVEYEDGSDAIDADLTLRGPYIGLVLGL